MSSVPLSVQIASHFAGQKHALHPVQQLGRLLDAMAAAEDLQQRIAAWLALTQWLRTGQSLDQRGLLARDALEHWELLLEAVDALPAARASLQDGFAELLRETEGTNLFGTAGLPGRRGFFVELSDRLLDKVLPRPADEHDLAKLLGRTYPSRATVERFARLPPEVFDRVAEVLAAASADDAFKALRADFADGLRLLASRIESEGLSEGVRDRLPGSVAQSPFFRLPLAVEALLGVWQDGGHVTEVADRVREHAVACRAAIAEVARKLETQGVSIDIVYGLEVIDRCLTRIELMLAVVESGSDAQRSAAIHRLLALLLAAIHRDRSVRALVSSTMQLLQRKIVERSGKTGEHYIAWTRRDYRLIWLAAAGGGLLTVFTAAMKMAITGLHAPPFVIGLLAGINYAVSFLVLQATGLILATKQPAMMAAALATIMREHKGPERLDLIVTYAVQIVRSQLAAALANVIVVSLGAYAFSSLWQLALGRPFLDHHEAEHVFDTLSPISSLTIWYAALTGAILWSAALVGGWFDNWAAYRRLPRAISDSPLGARVGRARMVRLAGIVSRNIAGWGTNVSLGLMLGLTPVIGAFLGLPLDVRHVTLNTGTLSLATAGMGKHWYGGFFLWAIAGVGTMFVLNLGVSFMLSLYTAARAFGLPRSFLVDFARALGRRFLRTPGKFFLPPGRNDVPPAEVAGH